MALNAKTQIMDQSIGLNKMHPDLQTLISKQFSRYRFTATANQTEYTNAAIQASDSDIDVFINGILQDPSRYVIGQGGITFNPALALDDQVTIFHGNRPISELLNGEQIIRHTSATFIGDLKVTIGNTRWYPPYNCRIIGVYAAIGDQSPSSTMIDILKNDTIEASHQLIAETHKSTQQAVYIDVTPDDYITVDVSQAGGGKDLVVTLLYTLT